MTLQLHIIVLAIVAAVLVAVSVTSHIYFKKSWNDHNGRSDRWGLTYQEEDFLSYWVRGISAVFGSLLLVIFIISLVPFNPSYWVLTQKEGTIATISNRFVSGSGDVSGPTYTITLKGDPTPLIVDDSRVLGLKVGGRVDMTCSLEWVYGGAAKTNCYMRDF